MDLHKLQELIAKYNSGTATTDEQQQVEQWYDSIAADDASLTQINLTEAKNDIYARLDTYISQGAKGAGTKIIKLNPLQRYQTWLSAAIVLIIASVSFYFYQHGEKPQQVAIKPTQLLKNDIAPGGNQAVLTLADGTKMVMTKRSNGKVANQGSTLINKTSDHLLVYEAPATSAVAPSTAPEVVKYNTFTTPRGGKYDIILPDGSTVYLNAASSIRFPTVFNGKDRVVELTGEAYFEVTKNKDKPFKVAAAGQTVEVLGTHFNINAYSNEPAVKTTLLEGSVQVTKGLSAVKIKPGEQAVVKDGSDKIEVNRDVDIEEVIAWKNNMFYFNDADINTIMRQVARWYDVDVAFGGDIPADRFHGKISRNVNASQVLRILEISGIQFKIEGRKIIVK
ncbi:MAG: FecR domain-containing protein [Bacteroidota bacterium]